MGYLFRFDEGQELRMTRNQRELRATTQTAHRFYLDRTARAASLLLLAALLTAFARAARADSTSPHLIRSWSVTPSPIALETADGRVFTVDRSNRVGLTVFEALASPSLPGARVTLPRYPTGGVAYSRSITFEPATSLHRVAEHAYVTTGSNDAEVVAVSIQPGEQPFVDQIIDLPGSADALCVAPSGGLLFVGRRRSAEAELVVLHLDGTVLGQLDLPQSIEAIDVSPEVLRVSSARWTYLVDVNDPAKPRLVATVPRDSSPLPPVKVKLTTDFVIDGPVAYFSTRQRNADLQEADLDLPFSFPDADGDGVWRLGCLGDSNTESSNTLTRWCEKLADLIKDPRFVIVNFAVAGATAISSGNDAAIQVDAALDPSAHLDAAILAFGTNDTNLVNFSADPALFETQITAIADAIEQHAARLSAAGTSVYVATTPPRWKALFGPDGFNERIVALNDEIRARFPESAQIEFYDGFHPDTSEIGDGVHLNQRGQDKRAWRALRVLRRYLIDTVLVDDGSTVPVGLGN